MKRNELVESGAFTSGELYEIENGLILQRTVRAEELEWVKGKSAEFDSNGAIKHLEKAIEEIDAVLERISIDTNLRRKQ